MPAGVRRLWYRTAPIHAPVAIGGGLLWDWLTLVRIDRLFDNLMLMSYLAALGVLLVLERRVAHGAATPAFVRRRIAWVHLGSQFLFGALFSAYAVYYSRSTSAARGAVFLLVLLALMVANEVLDRWLRGEWIRLALYAFCAYSFFLFFLPVVTGQLFGMAVPAALLALGLTVVVGRAIRGPVRHLPLDPTAAAPVGSPAVRPSLPLARSAVGWAAGLSLLLALQWLDVIPPVPLALEYAGIYHHVERRDDAYVLRFERLPGAKGWLTEQDRVFRYRPGDAVWCFTAIFAPSGTELDVFHVWATWDALAGAWRETDRIAMRMEGGRNGGFRTFTRKQHIVPGTWRVRVETPSGRLLGRVDFEVVPDDGADRKSVEISYRGRR